MPIDHPKKSEIERAIQEAEASADVLVVPSHWSENGVGEYSEHSIDLFKDLKSAGVDVAWLEDSERRSYSAKRSSDFVPQVIFALATGVGANAAWAGIAKVASLRDSAQVRLTILRRRRSDGSEWEWLKYSGTGAEVADLMKRDQPPQSDRDED